MSPADDAPRFAPLPPAERKQIADLLYKRHRNHLASGETFTVEGTISHGEVTLTMRLLAPNDGEQITLEGRLDLVEHDIQDPNEARFTLMDFMDEVFLAFFEQERLMSFDLEWQPYTFQEVEIWLRSTRSNPRLEALADALLRAGAPGGDA